MSGDYIKYPRTPHLPWSGSSTVDDRHLGDTRHFDDVEVVVTEKLDGENTSLYRDGLHARSIDGRHHPSRDWVKALHAGLRHDIPPGWRICGENVYARHSVAYDSLDSYFYAFSVWNAENKCLGWDATREWCALFGLHTVPELFRGQWDEKVVRGLGIDEARQEGYVVRVVREFAYHEFGRCAAKYVRPRHVQTDEHWMFAEVVPNGLKS